MTVPYAAPTSPDELRAALLDARRRTLDLVRDLDDDQLWGPRLSIVNPLLWEIGHVAWFQERWVLRELRGLGPLRSAGDALYDSAKVAHDTRWSLPLPSRADTLAYMDAVLGRAIEYAGDADRPEVAYYYRLAIAHEDMHDEAFTYTRQTHGWAAPQLHAAAEWRAAADPVATHAPSDRRSEYITILGGTLMLGSDPGAELFVFDNEKRAHPVQVAPFRLARTAVTNGEFRDFVEAGGYGRRDVWDDEGWAWRSSASARNPVYWRRAAAGRWEQRTFERWDELDPSATLIHVNWYEADAYCRWAGVRLPTEAEWEAAATTTPEGLAASRQDAPAPKQRYPWGDDAPAPERANLEGMRLATVDATAHAAGDSAHGVRQLIGNAWEWTASEFRPYPGFIPDPYREYSEPWYDGRHMVLRGGCFATRRRIPRSAYRNFYTRDRRDVFAGFRVCARASDEPASSIS